MKNLKKLIGVGTISLLSVIVLAGCTAKTNDGKVSVYEKKNDAGIVKNAENEAETEENEVKPTEDKVVEKPAENKVPEIKNDESKKELFIGVWENEADATEIMINAEGTFLIDHYTLASQVTGTYKVSGMNIYFTNANGEKWQGALAKNGESYNLKLNYKNENITLYKPHKNTYSKDGLIVLSNSEVSKKDFCDMWSNEADATEIEINEDGTFVFDHMTRSSEITGTYEVAGAKITFTNSDDGKKWDGQLYRQEAGNKVLKINKDNESVILYNGEEN